MYLSYCTSQSYSTSKSSYQEINSWVSLRHYAVNLTGGGGGNLKCIDAYAVLGGENDTKFHVFVTKHKANT
jgi:hypothetical protein